MSCDGCAQVIPVLDLLGQGTGPFEKLPIGELDAWPNGLADLWSATAGDAASPPADRFDFTVDCARYGISPGLCGGSNCTQIASCVTTITIYCSASIRTFWLANEEPKGFPSAPIVEADPNVTGGSSSSTGFVPTRGGRPRYTFSVEGNHIFKETLIEGTIEITVEPGCGGTVDVGFDPDAWVITVAGTFGPVTQPDTSIPTTFTVSCACDPCEETDPPTTVTQSTGKNARLADE